MPVDLPFPAKQSAGLWADSAGVFSRGVAFRGVLPIMAKTACVGGRQHDILT